MIVLTRYTKIGYIDSDIQNAQNIEILLLMYGEDEIDIPFESISKLTKLKAFSLREFPRATNVCDNTRKFMHVNSSMYM